MSGTYQTRVQAQIGTSGVSVSIFDPDAALVQVEEEYQDASDATFLKIQFGPAAEIGTGGLLGPDGYTAYAAGMRALAAAASEVAAWADARAAEVFVEWQAAEHEVYGSVTELPPRETSRNMLVQLLDDIRAGLADEGTDRQYLLEDVEVRIARWLGR